MDGFRGIWRAWIELKNGRPGRRFTDHYCRRHEGNKRRTRYIAGGIALMAAGALLSVVPVIPGSVLVAMGAVILCAESRRAAHAMDYVESKAWPLMGWLRRLIARKPPTQRQRSE